jgi:AraC-like DNA-binding protein
MVVLSPGTTSGIEVVQGAPAAHGVFLDAYAFVAVQSGYLSLRYKRSTYVAREGDVILLEPGRTAVLAPADDPTECCLSVFVDPETLESLTGAWIVAPVAFARVIAAFTNGHDFAATVREYVQAADVHHARMLEAIRALTMANEGTAPALPPAAAGLQRAASHLHTHVSVHVSLDELAGIACLSKYHLTRLFHSTYGLPPHAYQLQLRLAFAKRLLIHGASVSRAGELAGFANPVHLHRLFRARFGVAPGFYASHRRDMDLAADLVTRLSQLPLRD